MIAYHCNRDGCDTWQRSDSDLPSGFTTLTDSYTGAVIGHFCNLDCLMHWSATHSMPTETVEL